MVLIFLLLLGCNGNYDKYDSNGVVLLDEQDGLEEDTATIESVDYEVANGVANGVANEIANEVANEIANEIANGVANEVGDGVVEGKLVIEYDDDKEDYKVGPDNKKLIMFHNNQGLMCLDQLEFLESMLDECSSLVVEEILTTEEGAYFKLSEYKLLYPSSYGVSTNFQYLPITFVNGNAYSGFNDDVRDRIRQDIMEMCG